MDNVCCLSSFAQRNHSRLIPTGDIRDVASIPGSGRSLGGGHGNPLQYSCLENPMGRGGWWPIVRGVTKSQTRLKRLSVHIICVVVCTNSSLIFVTEWFSIVGVPQFVYPFNSWWTFGLFWFLTFTNKTSMNISMLTLCGYMPSFFLDKYLRME